MSIRSTLRTLLTRQRVDRERGAQLRTLENLDFRSGLGNSAWVLYGLAKAMRPDVCVEIGAARGRSAAFVGLALKENKKGRLYSIDPHTSTEWNDSESTDSFELMQRNIDALGLTPFVEVIRGYSTEAAKTWSKPIELLFIDGDHSYEGVKADWQLFSPFVCEGGFVIFHDTAWHAVERYRSGARDDMGVPRFVDELRCVGYPVLTLLSDYGVSVVQPKIGGLPLLKLIQSESK